MAAEKEYNGVAFGPPRVSEVIKARNLDAAKTHMKKKYGPQTEDGKQRWVCGLAPQAVTGHAVPR